MEASLSWYYHTVKELREQRPVSGGESLVVAWSSMPKLNLWERQKIIEALAEDITHLHEYVLALFYVALTIETKYYQRYLTVLTASYLLIGHPLEKQLWGFYYSFLKWVLLKKYRYIEYNVIGKEVY